MRKVKVVFKAPEKVSKLLQKAARDYYHLDITTYELINTAIATSFTVIKTLESQFKELDKAIKKTVNSLLSNKYQCLLSIPGIGPIYVAGIISEIGFIEHFSNQTNLAKSAGFT